MRVESQPAFIEDHDPASKREMLKSALRLFVRDGVCETTIRAIAADAGYTNPALFKHFESKEGLAQCLFERCYAQLAADLATAIAPARPFRENLNALIARFAANLDADADAFLYTHEQLRRFWPRVSPALRRTSILGLLRGLLREGVRQGKVTTDIPMELLVNGIAGLLAQFARTHYFGEFSGNARGWVPELERMISKMMKP